MFQHSKFFNFHLRARTRDNVLLLSLSLMLSSLSRVHPYFVSVSKCVVYRYSPLSVLVLGSQLEQFRP